MLAIEPVRAPRLGTRRAYTLLELLIVVAVIALLAMVVLPGPSSADRAKILHASRLLAADIHAARLESIGRGVDPCVLVFLEGGMGYRVARASNEAAPIKRATGEIWNVRFGEGAASALPGVRIELDAPNHTLRFDAVGTPAHGTDTVIRVRLGADELQLIVDGETGEILVP